MKLGIENKPATWVAGALALLALYLGITRLPGAFTTTATPAASSSLAIPTPQAQRKRAGRKGAAPLLTATLDPRLRLDLLKASENTEYQGSGRYIFRAEAEPEPIPKPVTPPIGPTNPGPTTPTVVTPPPPPPIPLKFFGIASKAGEPKRALLADGEDVFVAKEGDIVDRHYKVNKIGVNSVEIIDVLNNNTQTIPLTAQG